MKLLIIGAGAIGCLVGGKLARAGHTVTLVGRPRFAQVVQRDGLHLRDETGDHRIESLRPAGNVGDAFANVDAGVEYDAVILTVKSYDTATALDELDAARPNWAMAASPVVSMQNGVGNEERSQPRYGPAATIAGTLTTPVSVPELGVIQVDKPRYSMGISAWVQGMYTRPTTALEHALGEAGFDVKNYANARGMKWTKLLMNMLGNATCAILDAPPARVFADSGIVDIEIEAWREALAVMDAMGIAPIALGGYPFNLLAPAIRYAPNGTIRTVLRWMIGGARGGKMPSLHLDLHGGKGRSEVGWLNGAVVRCGREVGISTPVNRVLTTVVGSLLVDVNARSDWKGNGARLVESVHEEKKRAANSD